MNGMTKLHVDGFGTYCGKVGLEEDTCSRSRQRKVVNKGALFATTMICQGIL